MSMKKLRNKCPCCKEYLYDKDGTALCLECGYEDWYFYFRKAERGKQKKEKVPVGCEACGGPYPLCKDSCNLFDT